MTIRVLSFDFDGCLFNQHYMDSVEKDVIKSNDAFFSNIQKENQDFTKVYTFVGSDRQSQKIDNCNTDHKKGSCFPAVKKISEHLGSTLDTFLLADVFGDLEDGTSFQRAMDPSFKGKHSDYLMDYSKVTITYAQIHKVAKEHPREEVIFDFYDDDGLKSDDFGYKVGSLLDELQKFYNKNHALIPANVTIRLHHYAGGDLTPIDSIKGTGFIDINYRQTVKDLTQPGADLPFNKVAWNAHPETLQNRIPFPLDKFTTALNNIKKKATELNMKGDGLYNQGLAEDQQSEEYYKYKKASRAAFDLHTALTNAAETFNLNKDKDAFKQATDDAIQIAIDSELKNHRGDLKQILYYTGLAALAILSVLTAGLAYAVAGGINYAVNRQFFFSLKPNTDSINQVLAVQDAAIELTTPAA